MKMVFSKKKESIKPITYGVQNQNNHVDYIKKNIQIANNRNIMQMNIQKSCSSCK